MWEAGRSTPAPASAACHAMAHCIPVALSPVVMQPHRCPVQRRKRAGICERVCVCMGVHGGTGACPNVLGQGGRAGKKASRHVGGTGMSCLT